MTLDDYARALGRDPKTMQRTPVPTSDDIKAWYETAPTETLNFTIEGIEVECRLRWGLPTPYGRDSITQSLCHSCGTTWVTSVIEERQREAAEMHARDHVREKHGLS